MNNLKLKRLYSLAICMVIVFCQAFVSIAAPTAEGFTKIGIKGETVSFSLNDFASHTTFDEGENIGGIKVLTLPQAPDMSFTVSGDPITEGAEISATQIDSIVFTPASDWVGTTAFEYQVEAGGEYSNTAELTIDIIEDTSTPTEPTGFYYIDMFEHWGEFSAIKFAEENALIGEKIANNYFFIPEKLMTRGDFILLSNAAIGYENLPEINTNFKFSDDEQIPSWLKIPAYRAYSAGIIKGSLQDDGSTRLDASSNINRIETIVILNNIMSPEAQNNDDLDFADLNSIPEWSIPYVQNVKGYGLVKGYEDNTLRPFNNVTKAESVEMLYQLMKYMGEYPEAVDDLND